VSHPIASDIEIETKSYKHTPSLKEPIDITFIENGLVVFESIGDKQTKIHLYVDNPCRRVCHLTHSICNIAKSQVLYNIGTTIFDYFTKSNKFIIIIHILCLSESSVKI